ncbi:unnamed protein product [Brassica rapa subsp. narinosa]|uniref:Uncharacterized protein n=1 Tax=Brassica campestris TaxID=3711 RepID=M4DSB8_BRACM|nr:unnamed protein product [Brassica rapa]
MQALILREKTARFPIDVLMIISCFLIQFKAVNKAERMKLFLFTVLATSKDEDAVLKATDFGLSVFIEEGEVCNQICVF